MSVTSPVRSRPAGQLWRRLVSPFQRLGFWSAVLLPLVLAPLLLTGLATQHFPAFMALLASNAVAVILGRDYEP